MSCRTDDVVLTPQDSLLHNLEKMASSQGKVVTSLQQQRQHLKEMEVGSYILWWVFSQYNNM